MTDKKSKLKDSQFRANDGNIYNVSFSLGQLRKIANEYAMDVFNRTDWEKLNASYLEQLAFLYLICETQVENHGQTMESFETSLMGQAGVDAVEVLFSELANFYRRCGQTELAKMTELNREAMAAGKAFVMTEEFRAAVMKPIERVTSGQT